MKPSDQNDLIAYHLHELSPRQERALRRKLETDPELASESAAIGATLLAFPKQEPGLPLDAEAFERHWLAIHPLLTIDLPKPLAPQIPFRGWHWPALAGTAFAATAILISLHHYRHAQPSTVATTKASSETARAFQPSAPSTGSNATLSSSSNPNTSTPSPWIIHHAQPSLTALNETATGTPSSNVLLPEPLASTTPAQSPSAQPFPIQPSSAESAPSASSIIPSAGATLLSSTIPPVPLSTRHHGSSTPHRPHPADFTLAMFGNLAVSPSSTSTSGAGTSLITTSFSQRATPAVGALASFHQQFSPWIGYRITTTYSRPSFVYAYTESNNGVVTGGGGNDINHRIYELSATYAVQGPHHRRLTTSVEAGASLLAFLSTDQGDSPASNTHALRGAAIVGVGSELAVTRHWSIRAEYRAQLYKPPAFYDNGTLSPSTGNLTFSSNPILGITYHFGAQANEDYR